MHRLILLALILTACADSEATPPPVVDASKLVEQLEQLKAKAAKYDALPPQPRNFICERFAVANPAAKCDPELNGFGELATHTARMTFEGKTADGKPAKDTLACVLNAGQVSMVCDGLIYQRPKEPAEKPVAPVKPVARPAQQGAKK